MKHSLSKEIFNKNYKKMALATIINASGSSPRDSGAAMVIFENEEMLGTIGGGEVEKSVYDQALEYLNNENHKKSIKLHFDISNEEAAEVGGICGGKVDVLLEIINLKED